MMPADPRGAPFGPEVSWPAGYSGQEYRDGDYRYYPEPAAQPPAAAQGAHPYGAFTGAGYGDGGYSDPGYQGPAAQDAGIAGTRTVRGFVESDPRQPGYGYPAAGAGYAQSGYAQPGYAQLPPGQQASTGGYGQSGYAGSSYAPGGQIEMAYPSAAATGPQQSADLYSQPWDYDQPLRYEGEEDNYQATDGYAYGRQDTGAVQYQPAAYDPAAYNGSDYSMPGINGPGYDLSGIIGTSDFEAVGYDEPSYGRLSYDDPRYDNRQRYSGPQSGPQGWFDETRSDAPRFEDTRLDNLWLPGDDVRREAGPDGYGNGGFGDTRPRSAPPAAFSGRSARSADTRYDMKALVEPGDSTRFDVPRYDETRIENLRALTPGGGLRTTGTAVLAPPARRPRGWAEDTSLDQFADLDLTDQPVPAAFTRTIERPQQDDDTATRRAVGRRRGRSGDRRQWMALGAIAVVAAGAIGGVLMKYVFSGPSGPAHQVVAPQGVDGFTRSANLEKQLGVGAEAAKVAQASDGQASAVVSAVYQQGGLTPGSNAQIFMFVGGKLAGADPSASVANFEQTYQGSVAVSPGSLGGKAACTETHLNGQSASMCVWFDNDTFGTVVSPTMTTAKLAATMDAVRPSLELFAK
jgi:hypothetical protein